MPDIKLTTPGSMQDRIARRLQNSGGNSGADITTKQGDSAQRVFHNIHNSRVKNHGASGGNSAPMPVGRNQGGKR